MMNITFDSYYTCTFKDVRPGDVFSIGNNTTVYIMTDGGYHVNLQAGFMNANKIIDNDTLIRLYEASLTLKPKL